MEFPVKAVGGTEAPSPQMEYARRLEARRDEAAALARWYHRLVRARRGILGLIVALAWLGERETYLTKVILLGPPALLCAGLVHRRNRVSRAWMQAARAVRFYERRLACLEDRWAGTGEPGTRFLDESHPCALDLDLFGTGSLFELLHSARTRSGEETLAAWLLAPADLEEVRARQQAVAELRPRLDLREDLALLGAEGPVAGDPDALVTWAGADREAVPGMARPAAVALAVLTLAALAGGWALGLGLAPVLIALLLEGGLALWLRAPVRQIVGTLQGRANDLRLWATILDRLERERFSSPWLVRRAASLRKEGRSAAHALTCWSRLADRLNVAPLAFLLLGTTQTALAIEAWRKRCGKELASWLAAVGEFEALGALAAYAFDQPTDPFPELVAEGSCFDAQGLGHPLLPPGRCVRNDLSAWPVVSGCWWSAAPTWRARARCCGRWA